MILTGFDYAVISVFAFLLILSRFVRGWHGHRETPRKVDLKAADYLRDLGYRIRARAAVRYLNFSFDGNSHQQKVKADLIVSQGTKKYVVEVNTRESGGVRNADIRRRLLEYQIVFAPDGIICLDMDKEKLRTIIMDNRRKSHQILAMATVLTMGAVLYLLLR